MLSPGPNEMLYGIATDRRSQGWSTPRLERRSMSVTISGAPGQLLLPPASQPGTGGIFVNPLNGTGLTVGFDGSVFSMESSVIAAKPLAYSL
jgi:hypothetical protein